MHPVVSWLRDSDGFGVAVFPVDAGAEIGAFPDHGEAGCGAWGFGGAGEEPLAVPFVGRGDVVVAAAV